MHQGSNFTEAVELVLREDLLEGGVYLFIHPGSLFHMLPGQPDPLIFVLSSHPLYFMG